MSERFQVPPPSRRERIATAALQWVLLNPFVSQADAPAVAVRLADALIAELDKPATCTECGGKGRASDGLSHEGVGCPVCGKVAA